MEALLRMKLLGAAQDADAASGPSAVAKFKKQTKRIIDANNGVITEAAAQPKKKLDDKKLLFIISLLQKEKDNRSLHDLKQLTPGLMSPGRYIVDFMKQQSVKEKDLFKMCGGLTHEELNEGEFACHYGEKDIESRKAMILIDGTVSVLVPVHPEVMLGYVQEIIAEMEQQDNMPAAGGLPFIKTATMQPPGQGQ